MADLRRAVEAALAHPCLAFIGRAVCAVVRGMSAGVRSVCRLSLFVSASQPAPMLAPIVLNTASCARFAHPARGGIESPGETQAACVAAAGSTGATPIFGINGKACAPAHAFSAYIERKERAWSY